MRRKRPTVRQGLSRSELLAFAPDFPFVLAHTGAALIMLLERIDNGYRLFPDCRRYIDKLPS
jgi:hypothetical protein